MTITNLHTFNDMVVSNGTLKDEISLSFSETSVIECYDLGQMVKVEILDSLENCERRISEQSKAKENTGILKSIVLGAVIGGVIDFSVGDDSLLDGLLIGGAVGALSHGFFSNSKEEQPVAHIVLFFAAGERIPLKVDREGLSAILTKTTVSQSLNAQPARSTRRLHSGEIRALKAKVSRAKKVLAFVVGSIIGLIWNIFFHDPVPIESSSKLGLLYEKFSNTIASLPIDIAVSLFYGAIGVILFMFWERVHTRRSE